jgi:hypothetical protein
LRSEKVDDVNRIFAAIGWSLGLQLLWAFALVVLGWLFVDKQWIGDNFLAADYRQTPREIPSLTADIMDAMLEAVAVTLLISLTASLLWVVIGSCRRIYGPGQAARLRWLWLLILVIGALSCAGVTYILIDDTRLVPLDGTVKLTAVAAVAFLFSYYVVGTFLPTPWKIRPAVPLARLLPVG